MNSSGQPAISTARMDALTPAEILSQRRRMILSADADGYADLFAPDAVWESPFAPQGAPGRLEGREAIRAESRRVLSSPLRVQEYEVTDLYQTEDPEVVIVEMRTNATLATTGESFATTAIQILRIRKGQIVLVRDFANPHVLKDTIGDVPES